jgi:hypothetical protein
MVLSVHELKEANKHKHVKNKTMYKELLNHIYEKIQQKNKNGITFLVYTVSPVYLGKPLLNVEHACAYICKKLAQGNFKTRLIFNKIYIDWS